VRLTFLTRLVVTGLQSGIMVRMRMTETDEVVGELYLVPPQGFVAARDELVRTARAAGNRDLARELQSLRRPTRSAWLVNVLARHERVAMERLFALGRELRQAQTRLDETQLRRLSGQRQHMIADLLDHARRHAAEVGWRPGETVLSEVEGTLRAALVDLAASSTVLSGRLVRPMSHSGFGPMPHLDKPDARAPSAPAEAATADVERRWSFWPVDGEPGRREHATLERSVREHLTPLPSHRVEDQRWSRHESTRADIDPAEGVRRAEAELAAAESAHWQREQELACEEAAAEAARDRSEWLDQQRMVARGEKVAADRRVAEAKSAQRAAVRAVADARRALDAAERRQRSGHEQRDELR
jgi:hypothetical protein